MHGQVKSGFAHFEGPITSDWEPERNRDVARKQRIVYCRRYSQLKTHLICCDEKRRLIVSKTRRYTPSSLIGSILSSSQCPNLQKPTRLYQSFQMGLMRCSRLNCGAIPPWSVPFKTQKRLTEMRDYLSLSHLISHYLLNGALSGGLCLGSFASDALSSHKGEKERRESPSFSCSHWQVENLNNCGCSVNDHHFIHCTHLAACLQLPVKVLDLQSGCRAGKMVKMGE